MNPQQALQFLNGVLSAESFQASRSVHARIVQALEVLDALIKSDQEPNLVILPKDDDEQPQE